MILSKSFDNLETTAGPDFKIYISNIEILDLCINPIVHKFKKAF